MTTDVPGDCSAEVRCRKCAYVLDGLRGSGAYLCPECGEHIDWVASPPAPISFWRLCAAAAWILVPPFTLALIVQLGHGDFGLPSNTGIAIATALVLMLCPLCTMAGLHTLLTLRRSTTEATRALAGIGGLLLGLVLSIIAWMTAVSS